MTEPVLQALGIRYYVMRDIDDAPELIKRAQILAEDGKKADRAFTYQRSPGTASGAKVAL